MWMRAEQHSPFAPTEVGAQTWRRSKAWPWVPACAGTNGECGTCSISARRRYSSGLPLLLRIHVPVGARRRPPACDRAVGAAPHLGPLRLVLVPRARVEDADLLIQNLIELGDELDHLPI